MSFITRFTILIFILITVLMASVIYEDIEGFKSKKKAKPLNLVKEFKKIGNLGKEFKKIGSFVGKIGKTFKYLGDWFKWIGNIIKCSIETLIGLPNCIMFYMFDLFIGTIAMIIRMLTSFSPSLIKARKTTWNIMMKLDNMIYKTTSFRFTEYPKSIVKKCYKCKNAKMPKMPKL